ncbi:MAG TPA: gamma carbonic anhydrase family protein [Candidatus Faecousia intestinigallinarum]|nr:gamma carbonic anhydrase family protein [Candidatus Faecousia intestinigallinarum]
MLIPYHSISPELSSGVYIAPNATVIGNAHLGEHASVWFGAVVRADEGRITVGSYSNIQDNCTAHCSAEHPLTLGSCVTVGHNAMLHGCTVGDNCLIGMNATILDGAKIGSGCVVGAGALITEGKVFPDNSLILGVPAKAVKPIDEKTVDMIRQNALYYSRLAQEYQG